MIPPLVRRCPILAVRRYYPKRRYTRTCSAQFSLLSPLILAMWLYASSSDGGRCPSSLRSGPATHR